LLAGTSGDRERETNGVTNVMYNSRSVLLFVSPDLAGGQQYDLDMSPKGHRKLVYPYFGLTSAPPGQLSQDYGQYAGSSNNPDCCRSSLPLISEFQRPVPDGTLLGL